MIILSRLRQESGSGVHVLLYEHPRCRPGGSLWLAENVPQRYIIQDVFEGGWYSGGLSSPGNCTRESSRMGAVPLANNDFPRPAPIISHLTCEYHIDPLGIDVLRPRLSWQMQSDRRGARQVACRILAAASEESLKEDAGLLWDSGRMESDQSIHVPYEGPALASGRRVYWKVRVWDESGIEMESPIAWWTTRSTIC